MFWAWPVNNTVSVLLYLLLNNIAIEDKFLKNTEIICNCILTIQRCLLDYSAIDTIFIASQNYSNRFVL